MSSARELFYRNGVHNTGVDLLAEHAHVSKRTLYHHFPSKDGLIADYLRDIIAAGGTQPERNLARAGAARDRLLSVFDITGKGRLRGCPFHNVAVEAAEGMADVQSIVHKHKRDFIDRLGRTAAEAGAADPITLGRQLAVLLEGASALTTTLNDPTPMRDARAAAELLIDAAVIVSKSGGAP